MFLKISQSSQENRCVGVSFLINLLAALKKETNLQVFSREFYEIFKNSFFKEHLGTTASGKNTNIIIPK